MTEDSASSNIVAAGTSTTADASLGSKVNRTIEALRAKNAKLTEANKKLKADLVAARALSTRIRKIPGNKPPPATAD